RSTQPRYPFGAAGWLRPFRCRWSLGRSAGCSHAGGMTRPACLREVLLDNAERDPARTVYRFLRFPAGSDGDELTQQALDARARAVAARLAEARAERVLLLAEPGVDFV